MATNIGRQMSLSGSSTLGDVKINTGGYGSTNITGDFMDFHIKFDKEEVNRKIEEIRNEVNKEIRQHIKKSLNKASEAAGNVISSKPIVTLIGGKKRQSKIPTLIGESLNWHFKSAWKDHVAYVAGSYDTDENPTRRQMPTGVRGSNMTKGDKSLTELYEGSQTPFMMSGFIGHGSNRIGMMGRVREGEFSDWKLKQDIKGEVFVSETGYGKGRARQGKVKPEIQHPGWRGLGAMFLYHKLATRYLDDTGGLKERLDRISTEITEQVQVSKAVGTGKQQTLGAYSNLKGQ